MIGWLNKEKTSNETPESKVLPKKPKQKEDLRETVESIAFAIVLALLFRAFASETFVIPTGSMAPTLYGRHKMMVCEKSQFPYAIGASQEVNPNTGRIKPEKNGIKEPRVTVSVCSNSRYLSKKAYSNPVFKGDCILVNKFIYDISDPKRFDIAVFKEPASPKTNFIKRIVGLPNEKLTISHGDLFVTQPNGEIKILRKQSLAKQNDIQLVVYDNQYPEKELIACGWPERWAAVSHNGPAQAESIANWHPTQQGWSADSEKRTFALNASDEGTNSYHWLRYRNFAPDPETWNLCEDGVELEAKPKLISDFCSYNAARYGHTGSMSGAFGGMWTADLTLECELTVEKIAPESQIMLELTESSFWYRCRIDPQTGEAVLEYINAHNAEDDIIEMARAQTSLKGTGTYDLRFANVDDRLTLWVNGRVTNFGPGAEYTTTPLETRIPQKSDFTPVGIAAKNLQAMVGELKLLRDIYYRGNSNRHYEQDFDVLANNLTNVDMWQKHYLTCRDNIDYFEVNIPEGHYFALGDNSPASHDGRFWEDTKTVSRHLFIGKAFFIFWPRGIPFGGPDGHGWPVSYHKTETGQKVADYPLHYFPFYPNLARMKWIR